MSKFTEVLEQSKKVTFAEAVRNSLDDESYQDFLDAINNPSVSAPAIQRALKSMGLTVSVMTIQRMRNSL